MDTTLTLKEVYDVLQRTVMTLTQKTVMYVSQGDEEGEAETKTTMPLSTYVIREFGENLLQRTSITADDIKEVTEEPDEIPTGDSHYIMMGGSRRRRTVRRSNNTLHRNVRRHNVK
jgi:hypothetical protein